MTYSKHSICGNCPKYFSCASDNRNDKRLKHCDMKQDAINIDL